MNFVDLVSLYDFLSLWIRYRKTRRLASNARLIYHIHLPLIMTILSQSMSATSNLKEHQAIGHHVFASSSLFHTPDGGP